jgi:acylphosphatase
MKGWIKLHRKIIENGVFSNAELLKVFIWCLIRANSGTKDKNVYDVKLKTGQFITGRISASEELTMRPSTVHNRLNRLQRMQYIKLKSTTKYTIVEVIKFSKYQIDSNNAPKTPIFERLSNFIDEVEVFANGYDKNALESFISYWTETNKSKTKMKFELQQTWNTKLRLINWMKRAKPVKENKVQQSIDTWQQARNMINERQN